MTQQDQEYFINNPIFVKYRRAFDWTRLKPFRHLKSVNMNERIVELPFALQAVMAQPRGSRVLDAGCTESPLPVQLATLGYRVTGYDFRPYPYTHPNLEFVRGDILELPFEDNAFAAVICLSTLEHIGIAYYDSVPVENHTDTRAVGELRRVLQDKGLLVLTVPYGVAKVLRHQRVYDEASLNRVLAGFHVLEQRYFASRPAAQGRCNHWVEVDQLEAGQIISEDSARCVCLVRAEKK